MGSVFKTTSIPFISKIGGQTEYALEGSVFVAGAAVQWRRDGLGITRGTTAGHIARATLESIAFQTADLLEAMEADAGTPLAELRRNWSRALERSKGWAQP